jgi:hypothetical protein
VPTLLGSYATNISLVVINNFQEYLVVKQKAITVVVAWQIQTVWSGLADKIYY